MTDKQPDPPPLLSADEPQAWQIAHAAGRSPFLLSCDHAGKLIPRSLSTLGLDEHALRRHIAWDIGAAQLTLRLADALDACAILQPYSRLVIDCNRPLSSHESITRLSERTRIPGNELVSADDALRRQREIFVPYHACIRAQIDVRAQRGQPTLLIAVHSFTPVYLDQARPWHVGVLYQRDARLARALRDVLRAEPDLLVGDNEPYALSDDSDYSIPEHAERRGIPHVELEIRQDLIADAAGQQQWAERLARLLLPLAAPLI